MMSKYAEAMKILKRLPHLGKTGDLSQIMSGESMNLKQVNYHESDKNSDNGRAVSDCPGLHLCRVQIIGRGL